MDGIAVAYAVARIVVCAYLGCSRLRFSAHSLVFYLGYT